MDNAPTLVHSHIQGTSLVPAQKATAGRMLPVLVERGLPADLTRERVASKLGRQRRIREEANFDT